MVCEGDHCIHAETFINERIYSQSLVFEKLLNSVVVKMEEVMWCVMVGRLCEVNVNECESSPCLNGGTCIDDVNSFTCRCPDGYYDQLCTSKVNECFSNPCHNDARCVDGVNR